MAIAEIQHTVSAVSSVGTHSWFMRDVLECAARCIRGHPRRGGRQPGRRPEEGTRPQPGRREPRPQDWVAAASRLPDSFRGAKAQA